MQGKIYIGMFMAAGVVYGTSQLDKKMNYIPTEAIVTSVKIDCSVENSKGKIVEKKTDKKAYMDCEMAPMAAAEFGYDDSDIKKRIQLKYAFKSPVDGSKQVGEYTGTGKEINYKNGTKFEVFAHKTEAPKSRVR
jgi:hypothetical protein